ncbi:MAG: hypothetical protein Kow0031_28740 [Anaerolineae bacterium]
MTDQITTLETQLNDFNLATRTEALHELLRLAGQGRVEVAAPREVANMHCHTFFSFNGYGYSPSALAWLARKNGYKLIGMIDFDVLDGVDEFLAACDATGVRGSTGIETRVYFPQFASRETNSPGEPGVTYHIGLGFAAGQPPADVAPILADMRERAAERNRSMIERINSHLAPVQVDYERDVLPLTPAGNATERHMLTAYVAAAERIAPDPVDFWAGKLNLEPQKVAGLYPNLAAFKNVVRARLMKRGGVGYVQPGPDTFPSMAQVNRLIVAGGGLPCVGWLDGLSEGEAAVEELLTLHVESGSVTLNIVPDRNWNIADPDVKRVKLARLYEIVEWAGKLDLPLNIGTEMNAEGQILLDDFDAPELEPVRQPFMDGAYFIYGHVTAQRALGLGYQSGWAAQHLPTRRERNRFYTALGKAIEPGPDGLARLRALDGALSPDDIVESVKRKT